MFKVGDTVRQTKPYCYSEAVGDKLLVIKGVTGGSLWPYLATLVEEDYHWVFSEDELELAGEQQLELDL